MAFDTKQLDDLAKMKIAESDLQTIARIEDKDLRDKIISLITCGSKPEDAIKDDSEGAVPTREDCGSTIDRVEATAVNQQKSELTDDEWFEAYCGEKAAMLRRPERYKADAILFRRIVGGRHEFRDKNKLHVTHIIAVGATGALWNLVNRFITHRHPKDWVVCQVCEGEGADGTGDKCLRCSGYGYRIKFFRSIYPK